MKLSKLIQDLQEELAKHGEGEVSIVQDHLNEEEDEYFLEIQYKDANDRTRHTLLSLD